MRGASAHYVITYPWAERTQVFIAFTQPPGHALAVGRPEHGANRKEAAGLRIARFPQPPQTLGVDGDRHNLYWNRGPCHLAQCLSVVLADGQRDVRTAACFALQLAYETHLSTQ